MAHNYGTLPTGVTAAELDAQFGRAVSDASKAGLADPSRFVPADLQSYWTIYWTDLQPATIANGASVVVHNAADANQAGSPGVATVTGGALTKVNLTV